MNRLERGMMCILWIVLLLLCVLTGRAVGAAFVPL